jgi:hypothetical protein
MLLTFTAAGFIAAGATLSPAASAEQGPRQPKPDSRPLIEAPIGHRQPRAQDLPRNVLDHEGSRTQGEVEVDKKLKDICRGC